MDIFELQALINSGTVWKMEGAMGREAMRLLEAGRVILGTEPRFDYWGNRVPSRYEVKAGTKGSFDLAAEQHGIEYAQSLADVA